MIGFMEAHVNEFGVEPMCRVLQIAPSTWHEHARRKADPARLPRRAKRDAELSVHIRRVFEEIRAGAGCPADCREKERG